MWYTSSNDNLTELKTMMKQLITQMATMMHIVTILVSKLDGALSKIKIAIWNANGLTRQGTRTQDFYSGTKQIGGHQIRFRGMVTSAKFLILIPRIRF